MSEAERRVAQVQDTGSTELDLADLGLTALPQGLTELTGLTWLDLSGNGLGQSLDELSTLINLVWLDLSDNALIAIPNAISVLTALCWLHLSGNALTEVPETLTTLRSLVWLNLSSNRISQLDNLSALTGLVRLNLSGNNIQQLPESLGGLVSLHRLNLSSNRIADLPNLTALTELSELDLSRNQLASFPESLLGLRQLSRLDLSGNQLTSLPSDLSGLSGLSWLSLADNELEDLSSDLGSLGNLARLNISRNRVSRLPDSVAALTHLAELDLSGNKLSTLPPALGDLQLTQLDLANNPLAPEVQAAYSESTDELRAFLRLLQLEGQFIHEAKLILVGEGAVGKTSLLAALRGEAFVIGRPATHGIEVKQLTTTFGDTTIVLNAWDFGGQPVYRPTHQLFFSAPAVYLVVWNPRLGPERSFVDYWIDLIRHRAGDAARVVVVATHGGPNQQAAHIDEIGLRTRYGDIVAGFYQVDNQSGVGVAEVRAAIAETASALPHVGRWYPITWQHLRQTLRQSDEAYLSYPAYERLALDHGLTPISARSLVRNAHALGHWICHAEDPGLSDLVILKPDWLSTAITCVLEDVDTNRAHGLLPHRRLDYIWNNSARPPKERYPPSVRPVFLQLMERFDISYRVTDGTDRDEPTSLVAQLVPYGRPDLSAWEDYGREKEELAQVCEIVESGTGDPAYPEGLMYQLIVRLHRLSMGRRDYWESVHWQGGIILDDSYNGRALITLERNRVRVQVRAAYPQFLLHRLTQDVRSHVETFWRGLSVRVMVLCGPTCGRDPGTGLFDVAMLTSSREDGHRKYPCTSCGEWQEIDELLLAGGRGRVAPEDQLANAVRETIRPEISRLADVIGSQQRALVTAVDAWGASTQRAISQAEERFQDLILALDEQAREGPRLFSIDSLPPSLLRSAWSKHKVRITLWCEHSRLPVYVLNRGQPPVGVYEIEVPREWLVRAAPWIKAMSVAIRCLLPISIAALPFELPQVQVSAVRDQLHGAESTLDALARLGSDIATGDRMSALEPGDVMDHWARYVDGSLLRTFHTFVRARDPSFAGLERVRDRLRYIWIHRQFVALYDPPPPQIPQGLPGS